MVLNMNRLAIGFVSAVLLVGTARAESRELAHASKAGARGVYALAMSNDAFTGKIGGEVGLSLPDGKRLQVKTERVERDEVNHVTTMVGHHSTLGAPYDAVISYSDDRRSVFGVIYDKAGSYRIETAPNGAVTLTDISAAGLIPVAIDNDVVTPRAPAQRLARAVGAPAAPIALQGAALQAETPSSTASTIDLSVVYSTSLGIQLGEANVPTKIANLIALANQALKNSQVSASFRLVGLHEVAYADNDINIASDDLDHFRADFAAARAWRESDAADLVTFIRPYNSAYSPTICGRGVLGGTQSYDEQWGAIAVTSVVDVGSSCDDLTLAHELGHNLGAQHDFAHATYAGAYPYSYGYGVEGQWGDVMSYLYPRLPVYSNPNLTSCDGQPCGTATSNVAQTFNLTAPVVATYRQSKQSDPGTVSIAGLVLNQFGQSVWPAGLTVGASDPHVYCIADAASNPDFTYYTCEAPAGTAATISVSVNNSLDPAATQTVSLPASGGATQNLTFTLKHAAPMFNANIALVDESGQPVISSQLDMSGVICTPTMNGFTCPIQGGTTGLLGIYDRTGTYWDSPNPMYARMGANQSWTFTRHPGHLSMVAIQGDLESTDGARLFVSSDMRVSASSNGASCTTVNIDATFTCFAPAGSSGKISVADSSGHIWTTASLSYANVSSIGTPFARLVAGPGSASVSGGSGALGPKSARWITPVVSAATEDAGKSKLVYVAAAVPNTTGLFFLTQSGWTYWTGGPLPVYYSTQSDTDLFASIGSSDQSLDLSGLGGTVVFMGVAPSEADLLREHKYTAVYAVE